MTEYWVSHGKHYCEYCNANIQNHKRAIANHEESAHHKANVQKFLETKRKLRENEDQKKSEVLAEIARVSMAAAAAEVGLPAPKTRQVSPTRPVVQAPPPVDPNFTTRQVSSLAMFYANNSDRIDQLHALHRAQADEAKRKEQEELERVRKMLEEKKRQKEAGNEKQEEEEKESSTKESTRKRPAAEEDGYSAPMPGRWQVVKPQAPAEPAYETRVVVVPRMAAPPEAVESDDDDEDDELVKKEAVKEEEEEDVPSEAVVFAKRRAGAAKQVRRDRIGHE